MLNTLCLLLALTPSQASPAQGRGINPFPRPADDKGGAIIDLSDPRSSARRHSAVGITVKVLDLLDNDQVLFNVGAEDGLRKGQTGTLRTDWPHSGSMPGSAHVEITAVGARYAVGRFKSYSFLREALQREDNPVRHEELRWQADDPLLQRLLENLDRSRR